MFKDTVSPEETTAFGFCLGRVLQAGDIICLTGDLGAGKTHLTKGIAKGLGIENTITSPTYTIMQIYKGRVPLYHFDLYRVEQAADLRDIGFEEYIYGQGVSIIEWADKFWEVMPRERLTVVLEYGDNTAVERRIKLEASGSRYHLLLEELQKYVRARY